VKVCRSSGKEVSQDDIVRGYEYQKGDYVILDENDFKRAAPKQTGLLEIVQFSSFSDILPKHYDKPYYIEPDKKSGKAYRLLGDALKQTKKVAIARYVMKNKEHLAAIAPEGEYLVLHQLRYEDEIRKPELEIPKSSYTKAELEMAINLIKTLTKKFDPGKFHDTYTEKLEKVINAKARGKKVKIDTGDKTPADTQMKDLLKMLKKSLDENKKKVPA
jgi:DNA end-binding protein Ku